MGCGCGKKNSVVRPPSAAQVAASQADGHAAAVSAAMTSVMKFDVRDAEGALVASFTNPVTARAEARRVNGNVLPRREAETTSA